MKKGARKVEKRVGQQRQRVGRQARTPDQVPRTNRGIPRSLTLDHPMAAAALRHQCEEGTVPDTVFIALLEDGYGTRQKQKDETSKGQSIAFIGPDGRPWDERLRATTATTPQTTQSQFFTLANPLVRRRLQPKWDDGTMHPKIREWFIRNGYQSIDVKQTKPPLAFIGLPWLHDPMAEQERAALAAQAAQEKAGSLARDSSEEKAPDPVGGEHDSEDPNVPVLVREEDFP